MHVARVCAMLNSGVYPFVLTHTWGKTEMKTREALELSSFTSFFVHIFVEWNNVAGRLEESEVN